MSEFAGIFPKSETCSSHEDLRKMISVVRENGNNYYYETDEIKIVKRDKEDFFENNNYLIILNGFVIDDNYNIINIIKNLDKINGFFSLLLWDKNKKRLILYEDKVGSHSIYYTITRDEIIFATDIKSILFHPNVKIEEDIFGINECLTFGGVCGDGTLFKNIKRVSPGNYIEISKNGIKKKKYWDIKIQNKKDLINPKNVLDIIKNNIIKVLGEDREVGISLSGGIDSSLIVDIIKRETDVDVSTFTAKYEDEKLDESSYAQEISDRYDTKHHEVIIEAKDVSLIPEVIWETTNDPHVFLSNIKKKLFNTFKNNMKIFKGNGPDELFDASKNLIYVELVEKIQPFVILDFSENGFINYIPFKAKKTLEFLTSKNEIESISTLSSWFDRWERKQIYKHEYKNIINSFYYLKEIFPQIKTINSLFDKRSYLLLKTFESKHLFPMNEKLIKNKGYFVYPYMTSNILENAFRIPPKMKINKYILKKACFNRLPANIVNRKKIGFSHGMRKFVQENWDMVKDYIYRLSERKYFSKDGIKKILERRKKSSIYFERSKLGCYDNRALDCLFGLEIWFETFIDKDKPKKLKYL